MNPLEEKAVETVLAFNELAKGKMKISSAIKMAAYIYTLFGTAIDFTLANDKINASDAAHMHVLVDSMNSTLKLED